MESEDNLSSSSMENNKNILLSFLNKCSLCLDNEGFAVISELNNLSNNIYTYMGIMMQESDNLSNKICKSCFKIIVDFVDLTSKATKNEAYLRTLLHGSSIEKQDTADSTNDIEESTEDLISNTCIQNFNATFLTVREDIYEPLMTSMKVENKLDLIKPTTYNNNELTCKVCSKIFKTRKQHMLHLRSHNKNFLCPIHVCGKKFATKGDLEKHIRSHTGERPFQCDECKKSFTQRATLKAHKITIHNMGSQHTPN